MNALRYLAHYPLSLQQQIRALLERGELERWLTQRHPQINHAVQSDRALYDYAHALKQRYLKNAAPLSKVLFDNQQHPLKGTLGTHTRVSRVQGGKLKSKHELRVASLFREAPEGFLRMIVVHELAHLKYSEHDKPFYQLCCHMEPDYHQLELEARIWLMLRETIPGGALGK